MIKLDNRLKAAFELCRSGVTACDVGCDHALLAAALSLEKNCRVIASDIKDGPLEAARRTISEIGARNVEIVKSDGADNIDFADDVIICGMGGELIADIVKRCAFTNENTRFILQPMTKADFLRKELYKAGFEIIEERAAKDKDKLYSVMLWRFSGEKREIDEIFSLIGKCRDREYLKRAAGKLTKNALAMERSAKCFDEAKRLRELAKIILEKAAEDF